MGQQIGQMNGPWAFLFKTLMGTACVIIPAVISLQIWFVQKIQRIEINQAEFAAHMSNFVSEGPRYTPEMARRDNLEMRNEIMEEVEERYPPEWLTREMESLARRLEHLEKEKS